MPFKASVIYPSDDPQFVNFASRRSVVHSTKGIVSTTSPLATQAGLRILREGGNAADAAVAAAAVLGLVDPAMTGIGGDMFCLFYEAKEKKVHSLNGSGRSPAKATLDQICKDLNIEDQSSAKIPGVSVHAITVPGAAAGWVDTVERLGSGKVSLKQVLAPAIELAEDGFPVSEISAYNWNLSEKEIRAASPHYFELLKKDPSAENGYRPPRAGEIFKSPSLANTYKLLAEHGKVGFYDGSVAQAIVSVVKELGGHLSEDDLRHHAEFGSQTVDPISVHFTGQGMAEHFKTHSHDQVETDQGIEVWEHPPNGQGIVALMTLGILEELENEGKIPKFTTNDHNSTKYLHTLIEALRIAFADASWWVSDMDHSKLDPKSLVSKEYLAGRAKLFNPNQASTSVDPGSPAHNHSDTVYLAVTDPEGNGCSFINSVYDRFGTCIVPPGTGFALQNRGANFRLDPNHPNVYAPRKRPYHTIIPAMITNKSDGSLNTVYGVMGGFMQPQGHVQVLLNMLAFKLNPQAALDAPRICIGSGMPGKILDRSKLTDRTVYLEEGIDQRVADELAAMGHQVKFIKDYGRSLFGRGQVIRVHHDEIDGQRVYSAGSDPRGDGAAAPL